MPQNKRYGMNIYYFNITYTCNSSCIFCYSHNTIHSGAVHNEILLDDFISYLKVNRVSSSDRIIINGGEPFLHTRIIDILKAAHEFECEVLIYTNGRELKKYDFGFMDNRYRFVIPFHGHKSLHDSITQRNGSYDEMAEGLAYLSNFDCSVDIKVILNSWMIASKEEFSKTSFALDGLIFNGAVHITKMADTITSKKNNCPSVANQEASTYTAILFNHLKNKGKRIKLFDTCIADINIDSFEDRDMSLIVYFKDHRSQWQFRLATPEMECRKSCPKSQYCASAVSNFLVLDYDNGFQKGIE